MTTPDALRDAEYIADVSYPLDETHDGSSSDNPGGSQRAAAAEIQAKAKIALLDRLRRDLDIMVYCELSSLYYMDCSVVTFAIRGVTQLVFFTPKPGPIPESPRNQPYAGAILMSNLICILFHLLFAQPPSDEALRGYLHGGFLIDFVGQHGPTSKIYLVTFDILVLILQLIMMGIVLERAKTNDMLPSSSSASSGSTPPDISNNGQDHDLEERGVYRMEPEPRPGHSSEDIELESFPVPDNDRTYEPDEVNDELDELLAEPVEDSRTRDTAANHPLDTFFSGESVIMDMPFFRTIKNQWHHTPTAGPVERPSYTSSSSYHAALLGGRLQVEVTSNNRNTGPM